LTYYINRIFYQYLTDIKIGLDLDYVGVNFRCLAMMLASEDFGLGQRRTGEGRPCR
jgi:hypothetical protein